MNLKKIKDSLGIIEWEEQTSSGVIPRKDKILYKYGDTLMVLVGTTKIVQKLTPLRGKYVKSKITRGDLRILEAAGYPVGFSYESNEYILDKAKVQDAAIPEEYELKKINAKEYDVLKNGTPRYKLEKKQTNWTCNCTGFQYRNKCKHMDMLAEALPKRHPREELDSLVPEIKEMFKQFDKWEIVGSYRRGVKDFKDIDILVETTKEDFANVEKVLQQDPEYVKTMSGPDITRGLYHGYDFDVTRVEPGEWGSFLLYRTGSKDFNIRVRAACKAKGWALNEHGLFDENKKLLANKTEEDIFKALGMKYIRPEDRN